MTNENISGFLNSIAEAKRAFDAEPEYQRQIAELERDKQRLGETVASRELRIHQLKQDQETLTQRLRSAEVERDDAGFRALEEADKVSNLLTLVRGFVGDGLKAISAVEGQEQIVVSRAMIDAKEAEMQEWKNQTAGSESLRVYQQEEFRAELERAHGDLHKVQEQLLRPFAPQGPATSSSSGDATDPWSPKDWPYVMPRALGEGQSATDPTTAPTPSFAEPQEVTNASSVGSGLTETDSIDRQLIEPHEGQSDGPFASNTTTGNTPEPAIASSISVEPSTDAASPASPPERNRDESTRFKGRKYYDVTYFVPLHEWLSKGGTREDYDWRPLPEANRASNFS